MKFSIKDFFSECNQTLRKLADLVTFTEEIFNVKLHFLYIVQEWLEITCVNVFRNL